MRWRRRDNRWSTPRQRALPFIRYFLPRNEILNKVTLSKVVRYFHLAFKDMEVEEVYDVLMEHLIAAVNGYDPNYKAKVKLAVEAINHELPKQKQFSAADVNRHLDFDCARHLRLLARAYFLQKVPGRAEKGLPEYRRLAAWPPPADFFGGTPIGAAYYIQKWFRYGLQGWITKRMRELESKEGVYSLEGWQQFRVDHAASDAGADFFHVNSYPGGLGDRKGSAVESDGSMLSKPVDVSEMDLDWVQETNDVMFGDLSKADRMLLYLVYTRSMGMAEVGENLGSDIEEVRRRHGSEVTPVVPLGANFTSR
jgi:hypothetical protein